MYIPDDIDRYLRTQYSPHEVVEIISVFEDLHKADNAISARVLRCIIHLAEGSADRVRDLAEDAKTDYRDIILWAEYDQKGKTRLHDFNKPFTY